MSAPTDIGGLDRRLVLEAPVETSDGAGGVTRSYQAVTTLWASVLPKSARAGVSADALAAPGTHRIVIRRRDDVTTQHRFGEEARVYRVVTVRDDDTRRFLVIEAIEETN